MTCCREGPRLWCARTRLHPSGNQAGDEVGISTVYRVPCGPEQQPRFAYRMFIQPPNRIPVMTHFMTGKVYEFLIGITTDDKRPGSIIVIENGKPVRCGIRAMLGRIGDGPSGTDHRGQAVWQRRF